MSTLDPVHADDLRRAVVQVFDCHLTRPAWRYRRAPKKPVDMWTRQVDGGRITHLVHVMGEGVAADPDPYFALDVFVKVRGANRYWSGRPDTGAFVPRNSVLHLTPRRAPDDRRLRIFWMQPARGPGPVEELTQVIRRDLIPFFDEVQTVDDVLRSLATGAVRSTTMLGICEPVTPNLRTAKRACVLAAAGRFEEALEELRQLRDRYDPPFVDMIAAEVQRGRDEGLAER